MQNLQPNTTLQGGKYRIERVLGQGGFGITYLATQVSLNRHVAIKELFKGGEGQAINERRGNQVIVTNAANQQSFIQLKDKFKKEALRLARFNHPNLVKVHEYFEENGTAYFVMDYIEGEPLSSKLYREGCLSESLVLKYVQQLLPALETAHRLNIWHLDINPKNIMVDRYDNAYLIDFGASKHIEQNRTLTTSWALAYTPGFCPPELTDLMYESEDGFIDALKDIGPWTDIYALGATMYNLLSDSLPPSKRRLDKEGRNAFMFPSNVSSSTQNLIVWMMSSKKEERPQTINEIKSRLNIEQLNYTESTIINELSSFSNNSDIIYSLKSIARNLVEYDDYPYYFYDGLASVQKQGKYGFVDRNGYEVIPCIYENAKDFHEGLANVKLHGKWGFIDKKNIQVIPLIYESASIFCQGLALVKKDNLYGYVDHNGREIIQCSYESAGIFSEGLAEVTSNGKSGYIDTLGNLIIPHLYSDGWCFCNGIAVVRKLRNFFIERAGGIDKLGNEVIPFVYDFIYNFGADGFTGVKKKGKEGLIDKSGNLLVPCIYDSILAHDELVPVKQNNKWGFINKSGIIVIPFKYFSAYGFGDGMCRVRNFNGLYGYVNKIGNEIIPCKYQNANYLNCGLFGVQFNDKWGIINEQGKLIVPCIYDDVGRFEDGLAFVRKDGILGCVDMEGRSSFDYK